MVNPAAAERKRLEKKQAARNKEQKSKAQETATIKRDTRGLEKDVAELEQKAKAGPLSRGDREQLEALREELAKIKKAKDAYIEQHPEHKKFVYPHSEQEAAGAAAGGALAKPIIAKNGLPRYPERSVYYHPVFNPSGAAPPGMPYMEKRECILIAMMFSKSSQLLSSSERVARDKCTSGRDDGGRAGRRRR